MALELVKQKGFTDCGVAAIAMVLEESYEQTWCLLTPELQATILNQGMTDETFRACVERFGFVYDQDFTKRVYLPYWGSVRACLNLLWGRRAVVSTWSKNEKDSGHFVVFDGTDGNEKVLDPSTREVYDDWRDVEPKVMWLFSENAIQNYLWSRTP
jgi:ABC-type bacteriocin/lantibiotic exporter with double-glycine peptidase domain